MWEVEVDIAGYKSLNKKKREKKRETKDRGQQEIRKSQGSERPAEICARRREGGTKNGGPWNLRAELYKNLDDGSEMGDGDEGHEAVCPYPHAPSSVKDPYLASYHLSRSAESKIGYGLGGTNLPAERPPCATSHFWFSYDFISVPVDLCAHKRLSCISR
jgi:hypothetical protein